MGFQFEVIYRLGPENKAADALSCQFKLAELNVVSISPYWVDFPKLREEVLNDRDLI